MIVTAIFDIGKTNKKILLFDEQLKIVFQEETRFAEVPDDDGFPGDDADMLVTWINETLQRIVKSGKFRIRALNFSTYGATLVYTDSNGKRLTPVYNYLKPMPDDVIADFYEQYGGMEEFCRKTASPALGMLNSGLQILWLKKHKPEVFRKVKHIFHFPQYLSFLITGRVTSEFTSIGCHTAMWDYDQHRYHRWLVDEGITLPEPLANESVFDVKIDNLVIKTGIGIHDSSASLVPYFRSDEPFILISTGTWCIFMNPFNDEPLTASQLRKDSLCYMSIRGKQVKSSRLFLGHMHDVNNERLSRHFGVDSSLYRNMKTNPQKLNHLVANYQRHFFKDGIPQDFTDNTADLTIFSSFDEAYHQLMADLTDLVMESLVLVTPAMDRTRKIYVTGGFSKNSIFLGLLELRIPGKKICVSDIPEATALGAAMVVQNS